MRIEISRRTLLRLFAGTMPLLGGCGTIMYPERRGQPAGRLDWGVVAADALGLLLFFVPGVVAFAVDFATGAIYLPPEESYGVSELPTDGKLVHIATVGPQPQDEQIEAAVSEHLKREVRLKPGQFMKEPLARLSDFWQSRKKLVARRVSEGESR